MHTVNWILKIKETTQSPIFLQKTNVTAYTLFGMQRVLAEDCTEQK